MEVHQGHAEPWRVTLVDTGEDTMTGGRLKRLAPYLQGDDAFCFTYGDGVSDVNITKLIEFHRAHGLQATLTATYPPGRFGALDIHPDQRVTSFKEKPKGDGGFINGGFFVLSPRVIDLIAGDQTIWEREPLETLAESNQLKAYSHEGFWQPMDTLRDKNLLEELWATGKAPWKVWE
jgi:glucose-1-phosphate cytidylyltransferase